MRYMFTLSYTPVTLFRHKCNRYLEISGYLLRFHGESVTGGFQAEADGQAKWIDDPEAYLENLCQLQDRGTESEVYFDVNHHLVYKLISERSAVFLYRIIF